MLCALRLCAYKQALKSARVSNCDMPALKTVSTQTPSWFANPRIAMLIMIVVIQAVAAAYFLIDAISDIAAQADTGFDFEMLMDCVVALALIVGIVVGVQYFRKTTDELRRKDVSLQIARGALAEHIALRFEEWGLTSSEGDIALFAMKGCNVAEIASLRNSAAGTVRSQLSQIYAKAGVSSQSMLVSSFIEDLLEAPHGH